MLLLPSARSSAEHGYSRAYTRETNCSYLKPQDSGVLTTKQCSSSGNSGSEAPALSKGGLTMGIKLTKVPSPGNLSPQLTTVGVKDRSERPDKRQMSLSGGPDEVRSRRDYHIPKLLESLGR